MFGEPGIPEDRETRWKVCRELRSDRLVARGDEAGSQRAEEAPKPPPGGSRGKTEL
jgi:hypothetical protein